MTQEKVSLTEASLMSPGCQVYRKSTFTEGKNPVLIREQEEIYTPMKEQLGWLLHPRGTVPTLPKKGKRERESGETLYAKTLKPSGKKALRAAYTCFTLLCNSPLY